MSRIYTMLSSSEKIELMPPPTTLPATNVLFTAAGRRVSLVRQFKAALVQLGDRGRTITADVTRSAPAHYVADAHVLIPPWSSPDYVPRLLEICRHKQVRVLVPLIDTELATLARHAVAFAEAGTKVLISSPASIALSQNKRRTHEFFVALGVKTPQLLSNSDVASLRNAQLPVFVKPAEGSSSVGAHKVTTLDQLKFYQSQTADLMVQEFVAGDEFTIDVYVDFNGVPRCAVPRKRLAVRAGEVSKALTVKDQSLMAQCIAVVRAMPGAIGCITLQCFRDAGGQISFIEINPRFGGGFPLTAHAGANYPKWILQERRGEAPDYGGGIAWCDNLCMLRYDDELIIDGALLESGV